MDRDVGHARTTPTTVWCEIGIRYAHGPSAPQAGTYFRNVRAGHVDRKHLFGTSDRKHFRLINQPLLNTAREVLWAQRAGRSSVARRTLGWEQLSARRTRANGKKPRLEFGSEKYHTHHSELDFRCVASSCACWFLHVSMPASASVHHSTSAVHVSCDLPACVSLKYRGQGSRTSPPLRATHACERTQLQECRCDW